jgi:hypothetical protein
MRMRATPEGTSEKESVSHTGWPGAGAPIVRGREQCSDRGLHRSNRHRLGGRDWTPIPGSTINVHDDRIPHTEDLTVDSGEGRTASVPSQVG